MNNARSEEVAAKASFKLPWARGQRCIIPAADFDEPYWGPYDSPFKKCEWWRFPELHGARTLGGVSLNKGFHFCAYIAREHGWKYGDGTRLPQGESPRLLRRLALRRGDVDWNHGTMRGERAPTAGEVKELKTYNARDVDLVAPAVAAFQAMKPWTAMGGTEAVIFQNPVTNKPSHDERSQRDHYWTPSLRRPGIRRRRAYQASHLCRKRAGSGREPYIARQMGRKNAKMLFSVYAKWIDGADRGREKAKLEAALRNEKAAQDKAA